MAEKENKWSTEMKYNNDLEHIKYSTNKEI